MQYYVGTWTCVAGVVGRPTVKGTQTFALDSGVMRSWVSVPAQGKMKPFAFSNATTYDAKNRRYVQTSLDNDASWSVSFAKPWTGNTEQWTDHASDSGKLTRGQNVRNNRNTYTFFGYPTLTATKPYFKATCKRSS